MKPQVKIRAPGHRTRKGIHITGLDTGPSFPDVVVDVHAILPGVSASKGQTFTARLGSQVCQMVYDGQKWVIESYTCDQWGAAASA